MIAQRKPKTCWIAAMLTLAWVLSGCAGNPTTGTVNRDATELPPPGPVNRKAAELPSPGQRAASIAMAQIGRPYQYGGDDPRGFDCSGLVHYAWTGAGLSMPRTTGALWQSLEPVGRAQLRPGDVVFFKVEGKMSHVGLYVGGGEFVHAPASGRQVSIASLDDGYYRQAFIRGGRR